MLAAGYRHSYINNEQIDLPVGKVVCVGRNYAEHIQELNNETPVEPVLFIKPGSSVVEIERPLRIPVDKGSCHFETELAILIGRESNTSIAGFGLGLDLTLRDVQTELKAKGLPWEKAKAFDGSCAISSFVAPEIISDVQDVQIRLTKNGVVKQDGNTGSMITPVNDLLKYINTYFTLQPGDIVLTGTPAGVGPLESGDQLSVELVDVCKFYTEVK